VIFPFGLTAKRITPSLNDGFWTSLSDWEPSTFEAFHKLITPDTTVIDIGAWIGPTVLFAAHFAKRVIAVECDPHAMFELSQNVLQNPLLSPRISLTSLCISDTAGEQRMTGVGRSVSVIERAVRRENFDALIDYYARPAGETVWTVSCVTLAALAAAARADGRILVKIDTEGAEALILSTLAAWAAPARPRPALLVSMHNPSSRLREALAGWAELLRLYRHVSELGRPPRPGAEWTAEMLEGCSRCDLLVCDWDECAWPPPPPPPPPP
jgi:FkbM family methyltransferase